MSRRRRILLVAAATLVVAAGSLTAYAQRRWWGNTPVDAPIDPPPAYDGRFTFARLKFTTGPGGYYYGGLPAWAHGYIPIREGSRAETNFTKILNGITNMNPHLDGTRVVDVGEPDLFKYPVVYATEPGYMVLNDKEVLALRAYLKKGGFIIFDDFRAYDWQNFEATMQRVLPGERLIQLDISHPIFHSFFDIPTLDFVQAYDRGGPAVFYGMSENNDPRKPLQIIANYNNDVSQYWEWSDTGFAPIDLSNEAYKLGVNYVIYSMTH
ncbi:MAG: hypothetical protein DMF86_19615 [Acidobacteria bacterium]|nr:MAG: hypothetical protein DMF86_19615 [Acidobacteriota bacterium]